MSAQPTMDDIAKIKAAWDRDIAEWKAKVERLQGERDEAMKDCHTALREGIAYAREAGETAGRLTAAASQVEAMRKALEEIKKSASEWDGPLMRAWDASRAEIAEGDTGSGPRDRMESVISALFYCVADDALAALSAPAEERSSSSASLPAHVAVATATEEPSPAGVSARVRIRTAGWWEDDDDGERYFRIVCEPDGAPPAWPFNLIWHSTFTLAPEAEESGSQPPDMRSRDWRTLWDAPIDGTPVWTFGTLHDDGIGERAGVFRGWFDAETNGWVCKELGGYAPAFWAPDHAPAEARSEQAAVWDENAGRFYSARELKALLDQRDTFLVRRGMWEAFVNSLPTPPKAEADHG